MALGQSDGVVSGCVDFRLIGVVDFRIDGRPRRWSRAYGTDDDVSQAISPQLEALYGHRAQLISVRHATECEDPQYRRGEEPKNVLCPIGRQTRKDSGCSCSEEKARGSIEAHARARKKR